MDRLNKKELLALEALPRDVTIGDYALENVQPGIVHFGVGNFHRGHQARYVDDLLTRNHFPWGIIGISMQSSQARDKLAPQDFMYTEVTLGETIKIKIIRSILDILVAPENPSKVVEQISDQCIKLVTITITEKGYYLSKGKPNLHHPSLISDMNSLSRPATIYGYLTAAIIRRRNGCSEPLSIVCCDNLQGGGNYLRKGVQELLAIHDPTSLAWSRSHVSFSSSMVDRVTPSTDSNLRQLVASKLGLDDFWPVSGEPFSQWVIENNFAAERPPLDLVGVVFSNDIKFYEQIKLRFLNSGHSIVAVLGYLIDKENIHETLEEPAIFGFLREILLKVVLPATEMPNNFYCENYIEEVLERFQNRALPYKLQQVNTDSSQKIQQRWFPAIDAAIAKKINVTPMSLVIAAWVAHIEKALGEKKLNDPLENEFYKALARDSERDTARNISRDKVYDFLILAGAENFLFFKLDDFIESVINYYKKIKAGNVTQILSHFLTQPSLDKRN